jgi:hypothetical protein
MTPLRFKRNISVGLCAALVSWLRCPTYTSAVNSTYRPRAVEYDRECPSYGRILADGWRTSTTCCGDASRPVSR